MQNRSSQGVMTCVMSSAYVIIVSWWFNRGFIVKQSEENKVELNIQNQSSEIRTRDVFCGCKITQLKEP